MKYSSKFKCLKDKCPNNCCTNTEIKLSVIDLLRLKELRNIKYLNGDYVFKEGGVKMCFDLKTGNPYGIMNNVNNACPFLKNGLCTIYNDGVSSESRIGRALLKKGLSLRAVPLICRSYPEMIVYPELGEIALNSGCKGVPLNKWEYVSKTPLMSEVTHEYKIYRKLMRGLSISINKQANLMNDNKFLKTILKRLEELDDSVLETINFS